MLSTAIYVFIALSSHELFTQFGELEVSDVTINTRNSKASNIFFLIYDCECPFELVSLIAGDSSLFILSKN